MKRTSHIIVITLITLLLLPSLASAQSKSKIKKENAALRESIDSLMTLLEAERREAHERDSVTQEMLSIYEENESRKGFALDPSAFSPEVTDSLLNIWYLHRQVGEQNDVEAFDMDSIHFSSNVSDDVLKQRLEKLNSYITLPYNETVRNYMVLYSEKMPTKMSNLLSLSQYYMPIFEETFSKYNLPDELKYLAIIESALNPNAVSRAGAVGMWQFMTRTAKSYGLEVNSYVDERRDPFKSADAAARYLVDSYRLFGDWNLAISSYNCGPGNVNKAIRRGGGRGYWSVYNYLPRETRGYMPAFVGAMYAMRYCKEYGLSANGVQMPVQVDTFEIRHNLHFQQISDLLGISVDELRNLNPQYIKDIVPGTSKPYIIRLPYSYTASFLANEDSLYTYKADIYLNPQTVLESNTGKSSSVNTVSDRITYKVKKGDTLGKIAGRYHVSVNDLKKWNHLRSTTLSIGQKIYIHQRVPAPVQSAVQQTPNIVKQQSPEPAADKPVQQVDSLQTSDAQVKEAEPKPEYVVYVIKSGDNLTKIANRYPGVSVKDIMNYNKIGENIRAGQKIRIPVK